MIVKRTVSINADIDKFVREIYKKLVFEGVPANYSIALNVLLLAGILETQGDGQEDGWSQNTRDLIRDYITKHRSLSEILKKEVNVREFRTDLPSP